MRESDTMRFHRMPGGIGIVTNVGIIEVCHTRFPLAVAICGRVVDRGEAHVERRTKALQSQYHRTFNSQ